MAGPALSERALPDWELVLLSAILTRSSRVGPRAVVRRGSIVSFVLREPPRPSLTKARAGYLLVLIPVNKSRAALSRLRFCLARALATRHLPERASDVDAPYLSARKLTLSGRAFPPYPRPSARTLECTLSVLPPRAIFDVAHRGIACHLLISVPTVPPLHQRPSFFLGEGCSHRLTAAKFGAWPP